MIYDPEGRLSKFQSSQNLFFDLDEFYGCAYDIAWHLFQYSKSNQREITRQIAGKQNDGIKRELPCT